MKETVKDLYRDLIMICSYDESKGGRPETIDGKFHGVCIDFSRKLIRKLRESGYAAGLISTLNDDGFLHAAVIYRASDGSEVKIADPVADVRVLTGKSDEERARIIDEILAMGNSERSIQDYYEEMGPISDYDDSAFEKNGIGNPRPLRLNMENKNEILANKYIVQLEKRTERIQQLTKLENVECVADTATLLACQLLYEKGIDTSCSNYAKDGNVDITIDYNSLSEENKKIFWGLLAEHPENYAIYDNRHIFGYPSLGESDKEISDEYPAKICVGFKSTEGIEPEVVNLDVADLIYSFKKQTYMKGVYTRSQVLSNIHNRMRINCIKTKEDLCASSEENSNEEIALNEHLIYSPNYDMFFEDDGCKSRYIESLNRRENDWRTDEEIAFEAGVEYVDDMYSINGEVKMEEMMFSEKQNNSNNNIRNDGGFHSGEKSGFHGAMSGNLEDERVRFHDASNGDLDSDYVITSTDLVRTSQANETPLRLVDRVKSIIKRVKEHFGRE